MLDGAVDSSGGKVVTIAAGARTRFADLRGFERCLQQAQMLFAKKRKRPQKNVMRVRRPSP
jgi:hypothetical protein